MITQDGLDSVVRTYKHPQKYNAYMLAEAFGDDESLPPLLESMIKQLKRGYKKSTKRVFYPDPNLSWVHFEVQRLKAEKEYMELINMYERVLLILTQPKDAPTNDKGVTDRQIEQARAVPITSLIEFIRGFSPCLWHGEKTGSLHIIPNTNECRAYCHGACGRAYDAIDAYMFVHNCTFISAVKALAR